MGYDSHFCLSFRKKEDGHLTEKDGRTLSDEIREISNQTKDEMSLDGTQIVLSYFERHWYDFAKDLTALMKKHPDLSLTVTREGEDHDDTVQLTWPAGSDRFYDTSDVSFTPPVPDGSTVTVAVLDTKDSSLSLVSIPSGCDPDEWLEENFKDYDSNCTWQTVGTARLFGTIIEL